MPSTDPQSLFYLPDELVVQVVGHLAGDNRTLCALARTCQFLQIESEKRVYTTIELLSTNHLRALIAAFARRPERIASVETLKILYRFHDGLGATAEERSVFNRCVKDMKALKDWHIESPYDNFKWNEGGHQWVLGDMEEFRKALETTSFQMDKGSMVAQSDAGLSKLERLVIHTHGEQDDFWNLDGFHCLFRHPSLRHLHVSCLVLPDDLPTLEPYAKTTPLTTLIFDECELEPKSLGMILKTPKHLKHLTLGENVYNINGTRGIHPKLSLAPEASLEALMEVAHSLESLTHRDPYWRLNRDSYKHRPIKGDGMRQFHRLHLLDVDACSFLHRSVILSHTQAPPNLTTLRIRHARPSSQFFGLETNDLFENLPQFEPYTYLESLKTLDFIQGASSEMLIATEDHICAAESLRRRHATAYKLSKRGINMRVYLEATWKHGLIPPFLHGEPHPELLCVYDAEKVGFRRHLIEEEPPRPHPMSTHPGFGTLPGALQEYFNARSPLNRPPGNESPASPPQEKRVKLEEAPETDQLNWSDIKSLKNEVRRSLDQTWTRMLQDDGDSSSEIDEDEELEGLVFDVDDDDLDDLEWHDATAFEEYNEDDDEPLFMQEEYDFQEAMEEQAQALMDAHVQAVAEEGDDGGEGVILAGGE